MRLGMRSEFEHVPPNLQYSDLVRITTRDPAAYEDPFVFYMFCDSDCGGCAETRRSKDSDVVVLGGIVTTTTTRTQSGLPATSSSHAELRGISKAYRWSPGGYHIYIDLRDQARQCAQISGS